MIGLPLAFPARYTASQGMLLASAVAFRLFLWLMPFGLLVAGILAGVSKDNAANVESASKAAGIAGAASQQIATTLRQGQRSWGIAVVTGSVLLVWSTRTLVRNLILVSAHAWSTPAKVPQREIVVTTLMYVAGLLVLFAVATGATRAAQAVAGGDLIVLVLESAIFAGAWFVISRRLPNRAKNWRDLAPGCVLFGIGLAVLHSVSRVYLPRRFAHSSEVYGALGVAGVILAWLLLLGQLVVSSAIVNAVWTDYRSDRHVPLNHLEPTPQPASKPSHSIPQ